DPHRRHDVPRQAGRSAGPGARQNSRTGEGRRKQTNPRAQAAGSRRAKEYYGGKMTQQNTSIGEAAIKGAAAGLIGGAALLLVEQVEHLLMLPRGDTTGTMGQQAVEAVASSHGVELSKPQSQIA